MTVRRRVWLLAGFTAGWVGVAACGGGSSTPGDSGIVTPDGGESTVLPDADSVPGPDADLPDAAAPENPDAALPADADATIDYFGTPGPWPMDALTAYLPENTQIVDVSTDEAENIWAVSSSALYLLKPGETEFRKYAGADGLHLATATNQEITAVVGGGPDEAFVGYRGDPVVDPQKDSGKDKGKLDRVRLQPDGTLKVDFYRIRNNDAVNTMADDCTVGRLADGGIDPEITDWSFSEDRTVMRMLYDHLYHRGTLYVGYTHGVGRIDAGKYDPIHGMDFADHVHPEVINPAGTKRMGEWRALALDPYPRGSHTGVLWMGGKWTGGAIDWTPSLFEWTNNNYNCPPDYPRHPLLVAFSNSAAGVKDVVPVFDVTPGDSIYLYGIAALADGTVYFASGPGSSSDYGGPFGVAMWQQNRPWTYLSPTADLGLPSSGIVDMQRVPDDTVLFVLSDGSLWRWDPNPKPRGSNLGQIKGLPAGATRVYVDAMVEPAAIYVATRKGFALVRLPPKP